MDAFERRFYQRFLAAEDAFALVRKVQHFTHRFPALPPSEQLRRSILAVLRFRPCDRQACSGKLTEEPAAGGVGSVVGGVEYAVLEPVTVSADVLHPPPVQLPRILVDRFAVLVEVAPRHELFDVFDLDVVRVDRFDVAEQVFGQRAAVGIAGSAAFGLAEIGAFQRGPQYDGRIGVSPPHFSEVGNQRRELQRADVFREVHRIGMIRRMAGYRVGIVVDARDDLCALLSGNSCQLHAGRRSTGTAK